MSSMGKERSCPDCGMPMESNGCCSECGYGEEEEEDDSDETMEIQTLLDTKKALQTAMELVDRMIVNCD